MKTRQLGICAALSLTLFGCSAPEGATDHDGPVAESEQAVVGFRFDSTELATMPAADIPTDRLTSRSFDDALVQRALIQTDQPFTRVAEIDRRLQLDSTDWTYEKDDSKGQVFILRKTPSAPTRTPPDERELQRTAIARINGWGIPDSEIGTVVQRRAMREDQDGTAPSTPTVHRYKTFVFRAINRVRVAGHRAVVTHTLDGTFNRALVKWPPLAATGHLLRTRLTPAEIERRATESLTREGETGGTAKLRWKYIPTLLSSGEVTLTLKVGALMAAEEKRSGVSEEPREIDIDIDSL